jgi:hypothetical protein
LNLNQKNKAEVIQYKPKTTELLNSSTEYDKSSLNKLFPQINEYLIKAYLKKLSPALFKAKRMTQINLRDEIEPSLTKNYNQTVLEITNISDQIYSAVLLFLEQTQY